jgi:inward rectifier potassium channel
MSRKHRDISIKAGKLEFIRKQSKEREWRDVYRHVLKMTWPRFIAAIVGLYLSINLTFAALYWSAPGSIGPMPESTFAQSFFFSVQTLSTVGFGHMHPTSLFGNVVTTLETIVGIFFTAVITGLIFVRFSRPAARIIFSEGLVMTPYNGQPALQLRVGNLQHQPLVEAEFRLMMIRKEDILEEKDVRRFYTLKLEYDRLIMFPSVLTIRHIIDTSSPLHGLGPEEFKASAMRFLASVVCVDTLIQSPVQSQADYLWNDVRFGHRFVEIYTEREDGVLEVDYNRLHETESVVPSQRVH